MFLRASKRKVLRWICLPTRRLEFNLDDGSKGKWSHRVLVESLETKNAFLKVAFSSSIRVERLRRSVDYQRSIKNLERLFFK